MSLLQWLFRTKPEEPSTRRILTDISERVEALERAFKGIRDEWEEHYERSHRLLGRMNARLRASKNDDRDEGDQEDTPPAPSRPSIHDLRARYLRARGG